MVKTAREAVLRASRGEGPTLIEALTYRMSGHSTSDDASRYRPEEQMSAWTTLDPIHRLRRYLEARVGWTEGQQAAFEAEVAGELKLVIETAEKVTLPALETMFDDVYATLPWHLQEQRAELLAGPRAKGH